MYLQLPLGSLHKLRLHFLAFDHVPTPPSLHFLCCKFSIFLTIYPPLNANVICEGSPISLTYILTYDKYEVGYTVDFMFFISYRNHYRWLGTRYIQISVNLSQKMTRDCLRVVYKLHRHFLKIVTIQKETLHQSHSK